MPKSCKKCWPKRFLGVVCILTNTLSDDVAHVCYRWDPNDFPHKPGHASVLTNPRRLAGHIARKAVVEPLNGAIHRSCLSRDDQSPESDASQKDYGQEHSPLRC